MGKHWDVCPVCRARNLLDGLELPTPPFLCDPHTKHPCLTDKEFLEKIGVHTLSCQECGTSVTVEDLALLGYDLSELICALFIAEKVVVLCKSCATALGVEK
ncbi:MAG: hypothetical protein QXI19_07735 [Candidatus Caldarchaeum sp.]